MALNCWVLPVVTEGFAGVTAIDWSTGAVTVNCAVPLTPLRSAVIVTGPPAATPVAKPWLPPALLIVAMLVFEDDHVTEAVRFGVVPSE